MNGLTLITYYTLIYLHVAASDVLRNLIKENMEHVQKLSFKFSATLSQFIK